MPPSDQTPPDLWPEHRLIGLEALRFLAAFGVLVWHYEHFFFVGLSPLGWDMHRAPFYRLLAPFYLYGNAGVNLFWCISGFIFTWKYGAVISQAGLSFGRFMYWRFSRLYPLHLVTLLIVAALQPVYAGRYGAGFIYLFNDLPHFVMNLFFASWWGFQRGMSFNGPSWSISAEILIYILFYALCRLAGTGWRVDLAALLGMSILGAVMRSVAGITLSFTGAGTFFYLGAMTCHLYRLTLWLPPASRRRVAFGCAFLVAACVGLTAIRALKIDGAGLAMFPAVLILAQIAIPAERSHRWLIGLGNLTYASYMVHFPMQLAAVLALGAFGVSARSIAYSDWFFLAYLGTVLAVSALVFRYFERPAQDGLRRLVTAAPVASRSAASARSAGDRRPAENG